VAGVPGIRGTYCETARPEVVIESKIGKWIDVEHKITRNVGKK
jgi:hypothetical protein